MQTAKKTKQTTKIEKKLKLDLVDMPFETFQAIRKLSLSQFRAQKQIDFAGYAYTFLAGNYLPTLYKNINHQLVSHFKKIKEEEYSEITNSSELYAQLAIIMGMETTPFIESFKNDLIGFTSIKLRSQERELTANHREHIQEFKMKIRNLKKTVAAPTQIIVEDRTFDEMQQIILKGLKRCEELYSELSSEKKKNEAMLETCEAHKKCQETIELLQNERESILQKEKDIIALELIVKKQQKSYKKIQQQNIHLLKEMSEFTNYKVLETHKILTETIPPEYTDIHLTSFKTYGPQSQNAIIIQLMSDLRKLTLHNGTLKEKVDALIDKINLNKLALKTKHETLVNLVNENAVINIKFLTNYFTYIQNNKNKRGKHKRIIVDHLFCDCCERNTTPKYFSFQINPSTKHELSKYGLDGVMLIDYKKCHKDIKKIHLSAISKLCQIYGSKSAIWYRHFLNTRPDSKDKDQRFYNTYLLHTGVELKDFLKCDNKKVKYFKYYRKLDLEGGFKNLAYNLSQDDITTIMKENKDKLKKKTAAFLISNTYKGSSSVKYAEDSIKQEYDIKDSRKEGTKKMRNKIGKALRSMNYVHFEELKELNQTLSTLGLPIVNLADTNIVSKLEYMIGKQDKRLGYSSNSSDYDSIESDD
jgi:hypothetical protein